MKMAFKFGLIVALCMLLWPGIAGAAPPAPQGKLVYEDDFNDPKKSGLENNLTATDYSRGFHAPGVYHLKDIKNGETQWELFPNQSYGDFTFQADVWDNSDDVTAGDISEGLVFRAKDDTHFYTILVDPRKGNYAVRKLDGKDTWSDLVAWTASPLVKRKSDVNQLRVDAAGSKFTIYLNGETLTSFSDSAYAKGQIGFIASNVDATSNHIHYDNPKVWTTEAAGPQPAGLPNTGQGGDGAPLLLALALSLLSTGIWLRRKTIPQR